MKTDTKAEIHNETIASPVVRIDALDENYVEPLREFFALNGCQVFINSSPSAYTTYHLIVGDLIFVKYILDNHKITSQKAMSVIWEVNEDDVASLNSPYTKYALIDPKPITASVLEKLCNFFFTGTQKIKNYQTAPIQKNTKSETETQSFEKTPKQREPEKENTTDVQHDIQRIAHTIAQTFLTKEVKEISKTKIPNNRKKSKSRKIRLILSLLLFSFLLPICLYVVSLGAMLIIIYRQSLCLTKPNLPCIKEPAHSMQSWSTHARRLLPYVQTLFHLIHQDTIADTNSITTLEKVSATLASTIEIENLATDFSQSFFTTDLSKADATTTVVQVEKLKTQIFSLHTNLDLSYRLIEQIMKHPPFPLSIPSITIKAEQGIDILEIVRTRLQTAERLLLLYPYIAGFKEPLHLLFLFQNSTELRPTGGFIGSIMEMSIEDGVINSMEVQDVYAVDGQLRGHVDPPNPIRDIMEQEHWYLRDSNWDPNFEEAAKRAMWFYEKETGKTVQGVIAINSSLIIQILKILGSIQILDTKDVITAENFYEKSFSYTQTDFFPGSTQKKDFLGNLVKTVMTSFLGNKKLSGIQAFSIIDEALRNRNIQMYFVHPEAQQLSKQFAWAGIIPSKTYCKDVATPCVFDYNTIIESNLGVNKTNYYIQRDDTRAITIDAAGKITENITRIIRNTSNNQVGSGAYKNYMRFYVPVQAHITNFTIDNMSVPAKPTKKNTPLVFPYGELDTTRADFSVVAVAFSLEPSQKTTVSIQYEYTNKETAISKQFDLYIFGQKQSGIDTVPTIIRVQYPAVWKLLNTGKSEGITLANEGYLEYNSTMLEDSDIQIRFIKE
ncbi:MAG: DUF4012 domain-containing protein [Microgenomates group bacterium]